MDRREFIAVTGTAAAVASALFRQSVFGRLAGYEDVNDAERLRHDPAMRCWIVGGKAAHRSAASPSQVGRFETKWLPSKAESALRLLRYKIITQRRECACGLEVKIERPLKKSD